MNNFLTYSVRQAAAALAAALAMLLTACINDYGNCPEPGEESDLVTFSFQMVSNNIGPSRAPDSGGHDETSSEWPEFEDIIVEDDFAFYIFAKAQDDSWPMIMSLTEPISKSSNAHLTVKGVSGVWMVTAAIAKANLEEKLGYKIENNANQSINLRVAVIANAGGGKTAATARVDYSKFNAADFTDFIDKAKDLRWRVVSIHEENQGDSQADGIYKEAIPMYGMNEFSVPGNLLYYSNSQDPAWMGSVDMLRALAKIRVIDNIENKNPETHLPRIDAVSFDSRAARCYVLPYDAANFMGVQIDTPRPCYEGDGTGSYTIKLGRTATFATDSTRIGYMPEQEIISTAPVVKITVTFEVDAAGNPTRQEVYNVPLAGYNGASFTANLGNSILRNHIYTLSVNYVAYGTKVDLEATVDDWEPAEYVLDFTETVSVPNTIEWVPGTYSQIIFDDLGEVYTLPWDSEATRRPLECHFGIASPIGATWYASFINLAGDDPEAFKFIDENGDAVESVSGQIDDKKDEDGNLIGQTLRIITTNQSPSSDNKCRLQVIVKIGENNYVEAYLTDKEEDFVNFTIIQSAVSSN